MQPKKKTLVIKLLQGEVEDKLVEIRTAVKAGNRQAAVELAKERYFLLRKIEDLSKGRESSAYR